MIPWVDQRIALSIVVVCASVAFGTFWAPSMALLSDGWEARGVGHALGFALMNFAWAPGNVIGSAAGGGLAEAGGDASPTPAGCALRRDPHRSRFRPRAAVATRLRRHPAAETAGIWKDCEP